MKSTHKGVLGLFVPVALSVLIALGCPLTAPAFATSVTEDDATAVEEVATETDEVSDEESSDAESSDAESSEDVALSTLDDDATEDETDTEEEEAEASESVTFSAYAYVEGTGWTEGTSDNLTFTIGTTDSGLKIGGIKVSASDGNTVSGGIEYRVSYAGVGWQSWASEGTVGGAASTSNYIQAVKFRLTGDLADAYDIYYRVYVEDYGWLDYASSELCAGTTGLTKRVEAIEVVLVEAGSDAPGDTTNRWVSQGTVSYYLYRTSSGWTTKKTNGSTSGTTSSATKVRAMKATISSSISGSISYRISYAGVGWKTYVSDGTVSGSTSSSNYVQCVKFKLTGDLADYYDIYYRVYVNGYGWLGWAKNGENAGTTGLKKVMTAVQVKLVAKGNDAPGDSTNRWINAATVSTQVNLSTEGWTTAASGGSTAGLTGVSYRMRAMLATLSSSIDGGVSYRLNIKGSGWTSWASDGSTAGSTSSTSYVQAVQMKLTGDAADYYDIYYRVYVSGYGWFGWAKGGLTCGTLNLTLRVTAIQVKLVAKGASAPGATTTKYITKTTSTSNYSSNIAKIQMLGKAQSYESDTSYLCVVNRKWNRVGIFTGSEGNWTLKYYWKCTTGKSSTKTPKGTFSVGYRGYSFGSSSYTCYYYTQINKGILFHSVLYYPGTFTIKDGRLGYNLSHGCVRLSITNAKWIYNNIPKYTTVVVYE